MHIHENSDYAIYKWEGEATTQLTQGKAPDIIETGVARNTIRIVCDGSYLALFVNDVKITEVFDETFTYGDIALVVTSYDETPTEVHFDNLEVYEP